MPSKPQTICPKCGALKRGPCPKCGAGRKGWASDKHRGSRHKRGYDGQWVRLREAKRRANPLCEECERRGLVTEMKQVHHIVPFRGLGDPLRLEWDNLESLCVPCHVEKTGTRRQTQ